MPFLVDTNIISELRKPRPAAGLLRFMEANPVATLSISIVSLAEIAFGITVSQDPRQQQTLSFWLEHSVRPMFRGRVLDLSESTLLRWRILIDQGRKAGRTYSQPDLFLAATALHHDLTLVTRNTRDFAGISGLQLLNPWEHTT